MLARRGEPGPVVEDLGRGVERRRERGIEDDFAQRARAVTEGPATEGLP